VKALSSNPNTAKHKIKKQAVMTEGRLGWRQCVGVEILALPPSDLWVNSPTLVF
jgi:hypothetical protein